MCTCCATPSPPRNLPAPPESCRRSPPLYNNRALCLGRFHRRVVSVAVVERDGGVHAVLIRLRAPTAARMADMRPEIAARFSVEALRVDDAKIGIVRRNG